MAMVTVSTTTPATKIPKTMSYKTSINNFHDSLFSSYLNGSEESFILQLTESTNHQTLINPQISNHHLFLVSNKKKVEDSEIDVFNADKYFNEQVGGGQKDPNSPILNHQKKDTNPVENFPVILQTGSCTPSVRSKSSMNSRTALLHNVPRNGQPQKTNKPPNRKSFLATLGSHCSCGDKSSVDIDDHIGKNSSKRSGKPRKSSPWIKEDLCSKKLNDNLRFPVSNSKNLVNNVLEMQGTGVVVSEDEAGRNSLEVFGSPIIRKGKKSRNLDRSLNMLAWDAIVPKVDEIEDSSDDIDSDASSDLFEIESFSTNPSQYLGNQASSDGISSSITQGACYAPSEVSIDWSVVTASAADFSAMSDVDDFRSTTTRSEALDLAMNGRKSSSGKEMSRKRPGILSGCKSQKAVNVAGDVYKTSEKSSSGRHQKQEFLMPMTRFHAENEISRFDKRNGH